MAYSILKSPGKSGTFLLPESAEWPMPSCSAARRMERRPQKAHKEGREGHERIYSILVDGAGTAGDRDGGVDAGIGRGGAGQHHGGPSARLGDGSVLPGLAAGDPQNPLGSLFPGDRSRLRAAALPGTTDHAP